jgi:hypothetical protein
MAELMLIERFFYLWLILMIFISIAKRIVYLTNVLDSSKASDELFDLRNNLQTSSVKLGN